MVYMVHISHLTLNALFLFVSFLYICFLFPELFFLNSNNHLCNISFVKTLLLVLTEFCPQLCKQNLLCHVQLLMYPNEI